MKKVSILLGITLMSSCAFAMEQSNMGQMSMNENHCPKDKEQTVALEKEFLQMMITHHEQGMQIIDLAIKKSQNPKIVAISKKMLERQGSEVTKMKALLSKLPTTSAANYPIPGMKPMEMKSLAPLSGKEFDNMYISEMSDHFKGGMQMSAYLLKCSHDPKIRELLKSIHDKQGDVQKLEQLHS
ncbi:DUF305 domain-containing protein [Fluoribacter gormanii]|uniref:Uncharacterized conserved protein, DUF305 family n=1 Tax=Fluoribacter gormanii TaxID=464 RepID=A0A377GNL0_9GAMM|nr:DUF305 domain-containing protein [Fluoribacter gormanii]KTD04793.1 hypothetical protein Lgor_0875 [Fluoribacter gormanii]SIR17387.1 Uncharacterized conserved protein, DUF305 family [Fluoribacter gormanii]STO26204.1 Uncharacterized protein conserved in bacteria [Fluoribacter gormanii]